MGSPSPATLPRWELAEREREHHAGKEARDMEKRELLNKLGVVTAERGGLLIACRITDAALAKATRDMDEWAEKCRRASGTGAARATCSGGTRARTARPRRGPCATGSATRCAQG